MTVREFLLKNNRNKNAATIAFEYLQKQKYPNDMIQLSLLLTNYTHKGLKLKRFDSSTHTGQIINKALARFYRTHKDKIDKITRHKLFCLKNFFKRIKEINQFFFILKQLKITRSEQLKKFLEEHKITLAKAARNFEKGKIHPAVILAPKDSHQYPRNFFSCKTLGAFCEFCINELKIEKLPSLIYALEQSVKTPQSSQQINRN